MRQITAYLVPGDICDLEATSLSWVDHAIGTLSPRRVARIGPLLERPTIAAALRKSRLVEAAIARAWLVNSGRRSALERLAHLFCELLVRLQAVGLISDDGYAMSVTQTDLADTTGLASVHVNRPLRDVRREGLIELCKCRLRILDLPRLQTLAEFDPAYLRLAPRNAA